MVHGIMIPPVPNTGRISKAQSGNAIRTEFSTPYDSQPYRQLHKRNRHNECVGTDTHRQGAHHIFFNLEKYILRLSVKRHQAETGQPVVIQSDKKGRYNHASSISINMPGKDEAIPRYIPLGVHRQALKPSAPADWTNWASSSIEEQTEARCPPGKPTAQSCQKRLIKAGST